MVHKVVSRRVKSKVEMQLDQEKKDEEMRIKKQKHMAWLQYQSRCKSAAAHAKTRVAAKTNVAAKTHVAAKTQVTANTQVTKKNLHKVVLEKVELELYVPSKALNNSWADQTEFEDLRKSMLMRMAIKKLRVCATTPSGMGVCRAARHW